MATPKKTTPIWARILEAIAIIAVVLLAVSALLPSPNGSHSEPRVKSANNLKYIGLAIDLYAMEFAGSYPDTIEKLLTAEDITSAALIRPGQKEGRRSYFYVGRGWKARDVPANAVVAFEDPNMWRNGANVLFGDGHVEFVQTEQLKALISQIAAAHGPVTMPSQY